MQKQTPGTPDSVLLSASVIEKQTEHNKQAEALLAAYQAGDPLVVAEFKERHPEAQKNSDFIPTLLDARLLVSGGTTTVKRLSLEKLKKEAKELLKQLKAAEPVALDKLRRYHPKDEQKPELKLADAQLIIARENGLASWAKLKHHIEGMELAADQMNNPTVALDADLNTLHIRCGNDIKQALKQCGFQGEFLEVSNSFAQGPVPHFEPLETFVEIRSQFIAASYGGKVPDEWIADIENETRQCEYKLRALKEFERVVLWFEHDPYDQLCMSYVLAHLAQQDTGNTKIECILVNRFPGVERFIGIGQLCQTPESMIMLWPQRTSVSSAIIAYGARWWQAFTAKDPQTWWSMVQENEMPLPLMHKAYQRFIKELPWTGNGLSLTEQLALDILDKEGPMRPGAIFNLLMTESEALPFLGDIMLVSLLEPLWKSTHQAIEVVAEFPGEHPMRQTRLAITETGKTLLRGEANWLKLDHQIERWIGGIQVKSGRENWSWSESEQRPVFV